MLIEYDGRPQRLAHHYLSDCEHYDSIRALGDNEINSPPKCINLLLDGFRTEDFEVVTAAIHIHVRFASMASYLDVAKKATGPD